jgi:hypothetical protein
LDCSRLLYFLLFKPQAIHKAFALTGRFVDYHYTQGVALGYELLPFQGVLLVYFANLSQVYLNILLRCSLSYAKIDKIFFNSKAFVLFYIESFLNKGNKCHF